MVLKKKEKSYTVNIIENINKINLRKIYGKTMHNLRKEVGDELEIKETSRKI